ncbi:reverse transcriptase domain-containing protein [Tanacetum coccineum]
MRCNSALLTGILVLFPRKSTSRSKKKSSKFFDEFIHKTLIIPSVPCFLASSSSTVSDVKRVYDIPGQLDALCDQFDIHLKIRADGATRDTSRLRFFHFSLKGKAAEWLDRIPPHSSHDVGAARIKEAKKDDENEWLLSIFKQIHINMPFLEAMIHMPKGAKVKEGDPGSFTLPCLIELLAVKNALANLGASINLMPHSLFRRLGISKLKPTKMSIQLADRSIKYPIGVCENLLVKVGKFIFPVDFMILEMDKDELVLIILGQPFLAMIRVVIDVQEGKLSLMVRNETTTFNIGKSMKSKHSRDDYLYCADHTAKLIQE